MAHENAQLSLDEKFRLLEMDQSKTTGAMKEITDALGLPEGHRIEAFDHSHIQGLTPLVQWLYLLMENQLKIFTGSIN